MTEPNHAPDAWRAKYCEMAFETFGAPAAYLAKNAVTAAFSLGRSTALVLDMGAFNIVFHRNVSFSSLHLVRSSTRSSVRQCLRQSAAHTARVKD
jgi:hypothetical protein